MVTPTAQLYIANKTLNDFLVVLSLVFEGFLMCVIQFICPHIMTILAVQLLQCMYTCMPLSVQPPIKQVAAHPILRDSMSHLRIPLPLWATEIMFVRLTSPSKQVI